MILSIINSIYQSDLHTYTIALTIIGITCVPAFLIWLSYIYTPTQEIEKSDNI